MKRPARVGSDARYWVVRKGCGNFTFGAMSPRAPATKHGPKPKEGGKLVIGLVSPYSRALGRTVTPAKRGRKPKGGNELGNWYHVTVKRVGVGWGKAPASARHSCGSS